MKASIGRNKENTLGSSRKISRLVAWSTLGPPAEAKKISKSMQQNSLLFVCGFASSMFFGTLIASFAVKYGRRNFALLYFFLYSFACLTNHFNSIGSLLGVSVVEFQPHSPSSTIDSALSISIEPPTPSGYTFNSGVPSRHCCRNTR